jgi:hypothetical protein
MNAAIPVEEAYKILHRKLKTEQHQPLKNRGVYSGVLEGLAVDVHVWLLIIVNNKRYFTSNRLKPTEEILKIGKKSSVILMLSLIYMIIIYRV